MRRSLLTALALYPLTACARPPGSSGSSGPPLQVTGPFATRPRVTLPGGPPPAQPVVQVLSTGRGPIVERGQAVIAHADIRLWSTGRTYLSTYSLNQPTTVLLDGRHVAPTWATALLGRPAGTRVALIAPATQGFGPGGLSPAGVAPTETLVIVFDILAAYAPTAHVTDAPGPATRPRVIGFPPTLTSFPAQPPQALTTHTLHQGTGAPLRPGATVFVQYVTTPWGSRTPTDASYARGGPNGFLLVGNAVPPGWVSGLTGIPTGSRVLLISPPKPGFTATTGGVIVPRDTHAAYVIDILGARRP
ncbi:FKBP-type peptidyl-prolyl cis-trans isomerase [Acrocarpospora catenulata]|uniref:FKBP-type peptidyl-prolyl cis-trans isomerase n=1 Tax=Acrocarpospora catenulata TaxID=2836182 RepID=UPI001BD99E21|nr:FKBP-type peptidyl-prolyl cis-trans isomerase [Acrocarpospora catenulata]